MNDAVLEAIDDLNESQLEEVLCAFLEEQKLVGEFLMRLEKWKSLHSI